MPGHVQTTALLVRGVAATGRFHVQVTASTHQQGSDELLFRMIPDLDVLDAQLLNTDPNWITITFRGIGEMHGNRTTPVPNETTSWINLSPFESDEFAAPRAFVRLGIDAADVQTWQAMDAAIVSLAQRIAGLPANIEYRYDSAWQTQPFPLVASLPRMASRARDDVSRIGHVVDGRQPGDVGDERVSGASITSPTPMLATNQSFQRWAR